MARATGVSRSSRQRCSPPAAARTCTMRRATRPSKRARPPATTAPRASRRPARCRAAGCVKTKRCTPARSPEQAIDQFPFAIAHADLARGQQRFNIYCTPCHGTLGDGNGMVVQRGLRQAASFHQDRLRQEKARLLLRCDHQWLWRDAGLRHADPGSRSLADCGLRAHAAIQPARAGQRAAAGSARRDRCRRRGWPGRPGGGG